MTDRLFFALWPDQPLQATLKGRLPDLVSGLGGRPQRSDQWHVTLEFLGEVPDGRQPAVHRAAARVQAKSCTVTFDRLDYWPRPQVYCLATSQVPVEIDELLHGLRAALTEEGFEPDTRAYRPHVTLARKVHAAHHSQLDPPIVWPAERFALVRSVNAAAGSRYEPLRWWNLSGRDARESGISCQ